MIEQSNFAFEQILENTVFMQKDCFSSFLILVFQSLQKRSTKNKGLLVFEKVSKTSEGERFCEKTLVLEQKDCLYKKKNG